MRIDCSITENYLKEKARMTDNCNIDCVVCELLNLCRTSKADIKYDIEIVKAVQKWSDTHTQKTYFEDLLEKYPNAEFANGYPCSCVQHLGYIENCSGVSCKECWNKIMEDKNA